MSDQSPETRLTSLERRLAALDHDARAYFQMVGELVLMVSDLKKSAAARPAAAEAKPLRRGSCTIIPFASTGNAQSVE